MCLALALAIYIAPFIMQEDDHVVDSSGKIHFTRLSQPKHPWWLTAIQAILSHFQFLLPKLTADDLLMTARARTHLHDLGNFSSLALDGLSNLTASITREAVLSPLGTVFVREMLIERLAGLLRLTSLVATHPEILQETIAAPLVIAGLPRTGTTNLHALLSASGDFRFLYFYEGAHPFEQHNNISEQDPRIAHTDDELWFLRQATPLLPLMVNFSAETQVEEIYLESTIVASMMFETILYVPSYSTWLQGVDQTALLRYLKLCLQTLQWLDRARTPDPAAFVPRRWLLKSPAHFDRIPNLFEVFPDARVVVTHRNPVAIVKSACTMMVYLMRLYSDTINPTAVSWWWTDRIMGLIATFRSQEAESEQYQHQTMHVQAEHYWGDPLAMVTSIYQLAGDHLSSASLARMQSYITSHPRAGAAAIEYSMANLGLTLEEIEAKHNSTLTAYRAKYLS